MPTQPEVDFGDDVDAPTFEQILEMDDEDDDSHEFSSSIVFGFLEQAEQTFIKMETAIDKKDLEELSALGHFLKGSSATLGYVRIRDECEKIQHYGHRMNETGTEPVTDDDKLLKWIKWSVAEAKLAFARVDSLMRTYFEALNG